MGPATSVTLYTTEAVDTDYVRDIRCRLRPLLHPRPGAAIRARHEVLENLKVLHPADITLIHVEAPQLSAFPPTTSEAWNQELLLGDIDDSVPVFRHKTGERIGTASLRMVLFQWSPLEVVGWKSVTSHGFPQLAFRAVLLQRRGETISGYLVVQRWPPGDALELVPITCSWNRQSRRLHVAGDPGARANFANYTELAKPVFVALALLRELSSTLKPSPRSRAQRAEGRRQHFVTSVSRATAFLHQIDGRKGCESFALRDADGEPYTEADRVAGLLTIESATRSYADVPADAVREFLRLNEHRFPSGAGISVSEAIFTHAFRGTLPPRDVSVHMQLG